MVVMLRLIFVTSLLSLTLVAGGCANNRRTVISVHAEADVCESMPFSQASGSARMSYRLESAPYSASYE